MKTDLYRLLPAVYRNRDSSLGEPLRALLSVLSDEVDEVRRDIDRLYDNWFVETCDEWVVPYIGDLLGVEGLHPGRPEVFSLRAFVANTLAYRRRKGTASVLENISQDVSGWSASVVEFFQLLTTAQHGNHVRPTTIWSTDESVQDRIGDVGTLDLRKTPLLASLGTAFDTASRSIDIRPFTQTEGWHNVDRIGIFIWRLRSYPMRRAQPCLCEPFTASGDSTYVYKFHMHPVGFPLRLFVDPVRQIGATQRRREWEVPQPIGHGSFLADMARYYGDEKSLLITLDDEPLDIECIRASSSSEWEQLDWFSEEAPPGCSGNHWAYVDVDTGRFVIAGTEPIDPSRVRVDYHYGFSANIGGGPYGRAVTAEGERTIVVRVAKGTSIDSVDKALEHAARKKAELDPSRLDWCTVLRFMDSGIYEETILAVIENEEELILEAADGERPTLKGFLYFQSELFDGGVQPPAEGEPAPPCGSVAVDPEPKLKLSGLMLKSSVIFEGKLKVDIVHCTMIPEAIAMDENKVPIDWHSINVFSLSYFMEIDIRHSIIGTIRIDSGIKQLRIHDSIVDGYIPPWDCMCEPPEVYGPRYAVCGDLEGSMGPEIIVERSTILGDVHVRAMPLASDSIFSGHVQVAHKQGDCLRYSYVDASFDDQESVESFSRTPQRFRCQPDLALAEATGADPAQLQQERTRIRERLQPIFCSTLYGRPDYARLARTCPEEIRKGAENGSEMGAFSHLMEPQREANLREAVRRYLPFGLDMNILYADEETKS